MLLIDGVKYEEWTPSTEDEFEQMVKEHTREIFGEQSIYLDRKQKLKSLSGIGSIPDGFAIILGASPQWHIVEMELSSHDLYGHIVTQVTKFITGINNLSTRKNVTEAIYDEVNKDDLLRLRLTKSIGSVDPHKFLSDLISNPPILTIIIEKANEELEDVKKTLAFLQIKVVEFQTFIREGTETVHAHLFEPLYLRLPPPPPPPPPPGERVEITLQQDSVRACYIDIPRAKKVLFPGAKTTLELETDIGLMEIRFNPASWGTRLQGGLPKWFKAHPELEAGDKVHITIIEPMKKYRLEVIK